ncbi:hypothetical protein KAI30_00720 [Candidatus Bathyarchaeota archaeon]|nr:hypothetical protein [Candidatus Bathyarchaeota archaeon]
MKMRSKGAVKQIDTGHVWACPICGLEFNFVHVETETKRKHKLKKRRL